MAVSLTHNFVVERNVLLRHGGPVTAASYPLLKEDRDAQRRLRQTPDEKDAADVRPVLVDELCHVCASCARVTEYDFVSRDGARYYCSFHCKQKAEQPHMLRGMRRQSVPVQMTHLTK